MLSGPVTILNWSFLERRYLHQGIDFQIALAIRDEVLDLEANGIRTIQIDEAALREKLPLRKSDWYSEYLDFAIPAFRLTHSGVEAETQIHTHIKATVNSPTSSRPSTIWMRMSSPLKHRVRICRFWIP